MTDAYQDSLDFLFGRLNYERQVMPRSPGELRLGRMRRLLRLLGDPQRDLRIVHVAGTKGQGSTAAMIAAAISASGVRAGLFSSPHLHRLEERYN
ncbi:MAG: bifunctional folylpolyglutamate synthase/dihydrofolate synthase, partial [Planctomycetota bacterium]|nr:bifunctional folylpolyglutamate synthase/dihydrofolate synthase [Planctomycetota bacterium]